MSALINPDGTWQVQLVFGKNATVPVVEQMGRVFAAVEEASRQILTLQPPTQPTIAGHVGAVKDVLDTFNSLCSKEEPSVGASISAMGGPTGGFSIQATLTVHV